MTVLDQFRLDDEVALVTGGAGGIGSALAEAMAEAGADVAIADVDEDGLRETADRLERETDATVEPIVTDVSQEDEVDRMVATTVDALGGLDVTFANAGIAENGGEAVEYDMDSWDRLMSINLRGVFLTNRAAGAHMRDDGGGSIVNTASILGLNGARYPGVAAYTAAKGGVVQITRQLASELGGHGIRVNAIAPGLIETPMTEDGIAAAVEAGDYPIGARIPLARVGEPADLKGLAVYLASDAGGYTSGEVHLVDGGMNAI